MPVQHARAGPCRPIRLSSDPAPPARGPAGGQQTVMEGLQQLAELVQEGDGRISVMPGGGVTEENAATVARVTGGSLGFLVVLGTGCGTAGEEQRQRPGGGILAACAGTAARQPHLTLPAHLLPAGCSEVHGTFRRAVPSGMEFRNAAVSFGADDWQRGVTDTAAVARVKAQLAQLEGSME